MFIYLALQNVTISNVHINFLVVSNSFVSLNKSRKDLRSPSGVLSISVIYFIGDYSKFITLSAR